MHKLWSMSSALVFGIAGAAGAQTTIYSSGPDCCTTGTDGYGLFAAGPGEATHFTLSQTSAVTGATFSGFAWSNVDEPRTLGWTIFSDASDMPGSVIASGVSVGTHSASTTWSVVFGTTPVLRADTQYWLGFTEPLHGSPGDEARIYWHTTDQGDETLGDVFGDGNGTWYRMPTPTAYDLAHGFTSDRLVVDILGSATSTPEPSSLALLGTGMLALAPFIRRRRQS